MPTTTRPVTPALHVPSRRSVLRAAAWTAPAVSVAVAVPAFAATSGPVVCADANYEINWASNYTARSGTAVAQLKKAAGAGTVGAAPLTLTVSSQFFGSMEAASSGDGTSNLAVSPFNVGGTAMRGLTIMQRAKQGVTTYGNTNRSNHRQEVTLLFNRPVTNLQFKLTDIDSMDPAWSNGQYQDRVFVSGTPSGGRANQVTGTGTSKRPVEAERRQHPAGPVDRRSRQRGRQLREPARQRRLQDHLLERPVGHAGLARPAGRLPDRPDVHRVLLRLTDPRLQSAATPAVSFRGGGTSGHDENAESKPADLPPPPGAPDQRWRHIAEKPGFTRQSAATLAAAPARDGLTTRCA